MSIKSLPGYNGALNNDIRARVEVLEKAIGIDIKSKLPHLFRDSRSETDMSWREKVAVKTPVDPARFIDHTVLKADCTAAEISKLTREAKENNFKAVCVNGSRAAQALEELRGSGVLVACVVGFPLGAMTGAAKAAEAAELVRLGVAEIDTVMNIGKMKDGNYRAVYEDIRQTNEAVVAQGGILKVIFETCLLTQTQIIDASILTIAAGARFLKTSTGFNKAGANAKVLDIMLAVAGPVAEVKAAGGVRDKATAIAFIEAGVRRIGTSSGVQILKGSALKSKY